MVEVRLLLARHVPVKTEPNTIPHRVGTALPAALYRGTLIRELCGTEMRPTPAWLVETRVITAALVRRPFIMLLKPFLMDRPLLLLWELRLTSMNLTGPLEPGLTTEAPVLSEFRLTTLIERLPTTLPILSYAVVVVAFENISTVVTIEVITASV